MSKTTSDCRRALWKKREENNLCIYCGQNSPEIDKKGCKLCLDKKTAATIEFSKNNKDKTKQYRMLIKHQVIEKYGNKCACCGESQIWFLTIDHINNDGAKDRKENFGRTNPATMSWYLKLKREPNRKDLQVLCFNCNLGKQLNGGICPHHKISVQLISEKYDNRHTPQYDTRLKITWPLDEELIKMCNKTSVANVARQLKVDFSSVTNRLKRRKKYHLVIKNKGKEISKLNWTLVAEIRHKYNNKISTVKELGVEYKVKTQTIYKIIKNKSWKLNSPI